MDGSAEIFGSLRGDRADGCLTFGFVGILSCAQLRDFRVPEKRRRDWQACKRGIGSQCGRRSERKEMAVNTVTKRSQCASKIVVTLLAVISVASSVYGQQTDQLDGKVSASFFSYLFFSSPPKLISTLAKYIRSFSPSVIRVPFNVGQRTSIHSSGMALVGGCAGRS